MPLMSQTFTFNVPAGTSVVDLFPYVAVGSTPDEYTPAHFVRIDNDGAGTLRVGMRDSINTNTGHLVGPGDRFEMPVGMGSRIGVVGNGGNAAGSIMVTLSIGG